MDYHQQHGEEEWTSNHDDVTFQNDGFDTVINVIRIIFSPIWWPIRSIWRLLLRNPFVVIRGKHTKWLKSGPSESEMKQDGAIIKDIQIDRQLSIYEYYTIKRQRHKELKDYWVFTPYAYRLKNKCPHCGEKLYAFYLTTPPESWEALAGREGYMFYCPHCKENKEFHLKVMS